MPWQEQNKILGQAGVNRDSCAQIRKQELAPCYQTSSSPLN